jgi:thiamine phosphate synthase YjbQ (UPF0047 family)
MTVHSGLLRMQTEGHGAVVDLTAGVRSVVGKSGIDAGVVTVFATGSTVAVTAMEYEPGSVSDLRDLLERLIPSRRRGTGATDRRTPQETIPAGDLEKPGTEADYEHNRLNGDTNAYAHLRAALIGPSESIPVVGGELALGTWQQVVLLDFDDRPRTRTVSVHVMS